MSKPVLVAFEAKTGLYNVWRYDTPATTNVLFCYKAESREEAVSAALAKLEDTQSET